jgi:hypothetical protein
MIDRPPIHMISYITTEGNPCSFTVGCGCTKILEIEESGEYALVPWVEVWNGERLLARFNQHKLEHIIY